MGAPRKLSAEAESAVISWHIAYLRARSELRKLGGYQQKAKELGISERTVHAVLSRKKPIDVSDSLKHRHGH